MLCIKYKRCVASLLLAIIMVSGVFAPLTVSATTTQTVRKTSGRGTIPSLPSPGGNVPTTGNTSNPSSNRRPVPTTNASSSNSAGSNSPLSTHRSQSSHGLSVPNNAPDRQAGSIAYFYANMIQQYDDFTTGGGLKQGAEKSAGSGEYWGTNGAYVVNDTEVIFANQITADNKIVKNYHDWLNGNAKYAITDFMDMINNLIVLAGNNSAKPFGSLDETDPLSVIMDNLSSYETSGARKVTPNTLGHYLAMSFMVLTNSGFVNVTSIEDALEPVLSGYTDTAGIPLYERMVGYGLTLDTDADTSIVNTSDHVFNPKNLGVLDYAVPKGDPDVTDVEIVDILGKLAVTNCLKEYDNIIVAIQAAVNRGTVTSPENKAAMAQAKLYYDMFADLFPYISVMYNAKIVNGKSVADLVDEYGIEADAETFDEFGLTSRDYGSNVDGTSPLGMFYTVNSEDPIVSYDREVILNDIEVNTDYDEEIQRIREEQRRNNTLLQEDLYSENNHINSDDLVTNGSYSAVREALENLTTSMGTATKVDVFVEDGNAIAAEAVTINKWILEGMKYSATYVPMRTNLYSMDVLSNYDDQFMKEFFYKYGFNRKALMIDTSGTSAMDYYNSNGKSKGNKKICTLRDLMECGENDVTLYIDGNFYNAAEAISLGNSIRDTRNIMMENLANDLGIVLDACQQLSFQGENPISQAWNWIQSLFITVEVDENNSVKYNEFYDAARESIYERYGYDLNASKTEVGKIADAAQNIQNSWLLSTNTSIDDVMLKTNGYSEYSDNVMGLLGAVEEAEYVNLSDVEDITEDNKDTIVMPSSFIQKYLSSEVSYSTQQEVEGGSQIKTITYTGYATYNPLSALAFVSLLYRSADYYTLASCVIEDNPVFMASDELCGATVNEGGASNQWYRNSLLNWALLKNLKANVQVDYTYCVDLDCPVYMDIFGNILTESGIVVIPAASNATLHTAAFKQYNVSSALYSVYGKIYSVPLTLPGAYSVLHPFFVADNNSDTYIISPIDIKVNSAPVSFDKINIYDDSVKNVLASLYSNSVKTSSTTTRLNWMAMVNIINEVLRGAPISNIDKLKEDLYSNGNHSQSATVAAIKYESLLSSLRGTMSNTLISIPNFATLDGIEYYVALLIKFMIVATTAAIIILIYRDGVTGNFGIGTFFKSLWAIALTFICIVVTPAAFQITYYAANKVALEKEAFRILSVNEEKRQSGVEIGMTSATSTDKDDDEFMIQLDWLSAPWWKEIEYVLYGNTVHHVNSVKLEAYSKSPVYQNSDITLDNDGVYISTSDLFDSMNIEYTFNGTNGGTGPYGMYFWSDGSEQTANFYMPYYVFLQSLVANVNEYNAGIRAETVTNYNYTVKLMSGNRQKTVGLSYNYFNSTAFMEEDLDILRLFQIYKDENAFVPSGMEDVDFDIRYALDLYGDEETLVPPKLDQDKSARLRVQPHFTIGQIQRQLAVAEEYAFDRSMIFSDDDREGFRHCLWYNTGAVIDFGDRVRALDSYARDFVSANHDLMNKVTDETFIKVLALYMSIKYNQLFGVESANALEIYNLSSEDLLRLCLLDDEEAALSVSMSFPRLVYNYGGEASVYLAAVLSVILWVGSFIKPLCTIIVFISVFLSIWVFRVLLRRPSANLFGYAITVGLLCATNLLHALLLKVSVFLPNTGLSVLGCLIFMVVAQVGYLLVLGYVTGVSLKDWSNLGYSEYEKEAMRVKAKFSKDEAMDNLSGRIKHHEDNWDYYNDLVEQHRSRNA